MSGIEKDIGEVGKSLKSVVSVDSQAGSVGERGLGTFSGSPDRGYLGEGWVRLGDVNVSISDVDWLGPGNAWLREVVLLSRLSCLRPARLVATYSHAALRFSQREQVGFPLLHLTLEAAQAWQLSRSLGPGRIVDRRDGAGCVTACGDIISAIIDREGV